MKIIGVTGGIGSGKSTVARILSELGAKIIDADNIAGEIIKPEGEAYQELISSFGDGILSSNGDIDRKKLSSLVFTDKNKLDILNGITHKHIIRRIKNEVEASKADKDLDVIVIDAAIPLKEGFLDVAEAVWVVAADVDTRVRRVMKRNNFSVEQALDRINSQMPQEEYLKIAHKVIYNDKNFECLKRKVEGLYFELVQGDAH